MKTLPRIALLLTLAAAGCRSAPPTQAPAPGPAEAPAAAPEQPAPERLHSHEAHAGAAADAPVAAPAGEAAQANRDVHGGRDVQRYVESLASPKRVAELRVDDVVSALNLPEDAVVGDLGCGPGVFAVAFARRSPEGFVLASDIEPAQLDALRARVAAEKLDNVVPVLASADDPHFPPGRLDLVFVGDTYHHLEDRVAYFRRLQRALRPGGRLAILEYKPGDIPVGPRPDHKLPAGQREKELEEAGWTRIETFALHQWHDFEVWRVVQPWER